MLETLRALFRHEVWADAEQWRALEACPSALASLEILERLNHINLAQRVYLKVFRNEPVDLAEESKPIQDLEVLKQSFQGYHQGMADFLKELSPDALQTELTLEGLSFRPTVLEALLQAVTHSHHHRAQNALRLRELGGTPPTTDFLAWVGKGYPNPSWA